MGLYLEVNELNSALKSTQQTEEFKVTIYNADGTVALSYENALDMPASIELETGDYYVVKAGQTFTLDANATDGLTAIGTPGYTTLLSAGDIGDDNTSLNTLSIFDEKGCIDYRLGDPSGVKVHFHDFNFTNGDMAAIANNKFDDVGLVTLRVRDANSLEHVNSHLFGFSISNTLMKFDNLSNLVAYSKNRI